MNAPTAADVAKGLRELADRVEVTGLVPSGNWPLTFCAPKRVTTPAALLNTAGSLGIKDATVQGGKEEDGYYWYRAQGFISGVPVAVTAEGTLKLAEVAAALATAGAGGAR